MRKSRKAKSLKRVNLDLLNLKLLNSLARYVDMLLQKSLDGNMTKDDANSLFSGLKLLKDLKKTENENMEDLTDEQLKKLT
jgi:hypothetical protein